MMDDMWEKFFQEKEDENIRKKIYLAIPFTGMETLSFRCANEISSILIERGYNVFSPISHSYPISICGIKTFPDELFLELDEDFVKWADEIFVVNIQNVFGDEKIKQSKGVQQEMKWGLKYNKPCKMIYYDFIERNLTI
jgi:hypothetical protein